jgi:glutamyl-tRNA reductase
MTCYYLDHGIFSGEETELAKLSLKYKNSKLFDPRFGISLITCHRIEYYEPMPTSHHDFGKLPHNFKIIEGYRNAYDRLLKIATGLKSQVIGESAIFNQVALAIDEYRYYNPTSLHFSTITKNSKTIRDKFNFYAPNHAQLVFEHINKGANKTLVLVGNSMLNKTIIGLTRHQKTYSEILLVTRDVAKAKNNVANTNIPIKIINANQLAETKLDREFDIFIATNNITERTQKAIMMFHNDPNLLNIVDMSSVPFSSEKEANASYYTLYTKNTRRLIEKSNADMLPVKKLIIDHLRNNRTNEVG